MLHTTFHKNGQVTTENNFGHPVYTPQSWVITYMQALEREGYNLKDFRFTLEGEEESFDGFNGYEEWASKPKVASKGGDL